MLLLTNITVACSKHVDTSHREQPTPMPLAREQCTAIRAAERFVLENGYTDAPATTDPSRIVWELGDDPSQLSRVLKARHETLKPHAYGLHLDPAEDPAAYTIVFEYTDSLIALTRRVEGKPREQPTGAAIRITFGADGPRAVLEHMAIFLGAAARLPSPEQVTAVCGNVERAR
jgi:hypothetical protein